MNQGSLDIVHNILDWKTWILFMWVWAVSPDRVLMVVEFATIEAVSHSNLGSLMVG